MRAPTPLRPAPLRTVPLVLLLSALAACSGSEPTAAPSTGAPAAPSPASSAAAPGTRAAAPTAVPSAVPSAAPSAAQAPRALQPGEPQVVAAGLEVPWGLAFLPGGDALVSERETARVLRLPAGGGEPTEVMRVLQTRPRGEGGLLGLAVSPSYARDGLVYAYVTTAEDNRVVRFRLGGEVQPVLTGIPSGTIHNGGRLAFGPDGALYIGTGDTGDASLAQDPDSLGGKVLRLASLEGGRAEVFSAGHRNVQGLAFDGAGRLWATEFGQNTFDEVNQVRRGDNGGWPEVEGQGTGGGRFASPRVVWRTDEASPSGAAVAGDALWVGALAGERLWRVPLDGRGGAGEPRAVLEGDYGRLRTVVRAPDGALWITTSNRDGRGDPADSDDRVLRLPLV